MAASETYRFSGGEKLYIVFDQNGYVVEAKGFGKLMWSSLSVNKDLVGKHVDEVAQMLKEKGVGTAYSDFEINVHLPLLKTMLSQKENR